MRRTFESNDGSSLRTGNVESQSTQAGPGYDDQRETVTQDDNGDYRTQEHREFATIISTIQDQKSVMSTLATSASRATSALYVNQTSLATEKNRRETVSSTYQRLANVERLVPEVVLVTNFEPLFKPRSSKLDVSFASDKKKMTDAGRYFESQITTRAIKFLSARKIVNDNKNYSKRISDFTAQRKHDFDIALSTLKKAANYLLASSAKLEGLKLSLDIRNELYTINSVESYTQHINQYSSIRSQQLVRYLNDSIFTNMLPAFDVPDALRMIGYNEKNIRQAFSSTKVWLQTIEECHELLTTTSPLRNATNKMTDDSPTRIVSTRRRDEQPNGFIDRLSASSVYSRFAFEEEQALSLLDNVYQYVDDHYSSDDDVTFLTTIITDISREHRYSSALGNTKTVQFLSEKYGISTSQTGNNYHVIRSVVGNVSDNAIDISDTQNNSLASLAVTNVDNNNILVLEPFLTYAADNVISGGDYYVDSVVLLNNGQFDVSRLEALSKKIYDIETSFNNVVQRMNILALEYTNDQSYEEGSFFSKVSSPVSLFKEITSLFLTEELVVKNEVHDDVATCAFVAAHHDIELKSLMFLYTLSESSGNNNIHIIKKIVDRLFNVLHSNTRTEFVSGDSILRRTRNVLQNVSKSELTDAFLRQSSTCAVISTFMQKFRDVLQTSDALNASGRLRHSGQHDTYVLMKLFDSIIGVINGVSKKTFTGYTQIDNDEYLTIDVRSRDAQQLIATTLDSLKFEQSLLHYFVLGIMSTLTKLRKSVNDVTGYFVSNDVQIGLKNLLKLAGHDVLTTMLFNKNQTRIIASIVEDMTSALGVVDKRTVFDVDDDGDFDLDDQVRILDDSVLTSKMKKSLYGAFSSNEYTLENMNAKIFSIGIPPGLMEDLHRRADIKRGKVSGLLTKQNDVITVNVYKIDEKNPDIVWKPKKFLFEMSRFPVRNNRLLLINRSDDIDSIMEGTPTRDYSPRGDTSTLQYYRADNLSSSFVDDDTYAFLSKKEMKELYKNHVMSYAFELYVKIMTGLSLAEHEFTLADNANVIDVDYVNEIVTTDINRQNATREQRQDRRSSEGGSLFRRARSSGRGPTGGSSMSDSNVWDSDAAAGSSSDGFDEQATQESSVTPIEIKPIGVAISQVSQNDEQLTFYRISSIHELSRMMTPQTSTVYLTRKLMTPKVFDRTFHVMIDSNSYEVDVDKTLTSPHGKTALDSLIKSGELIASKKPTVERSGFRFASELKEYSNVKNNSTRSDLVFDKYFVTVELHGVS